MLITKEEIRVKITTVQAWTERALVALYKRQTEDEKWQQTTKETNGVGFSKFDAEFLSSLAQQLQQGYHLSTKQLEYAQKKIGKYAGQLYRIALENADEGPDTGNES